MDPTLPPTLGDLLTNAKKVTVSVLYWYEKLSSLLTEIFKLILKRIKNLFCVFLPINPLGGSHRQGLPPRTQPPHHTRNHRVAQTANYTAQGASTISGTSILS